MNRTKQISANVVSYVIVVLLLGSLFASKSYAETCVGTSPLICADFVNGDNPDFPDEFNVVGDNIILKKGALDWRVWSQVSASDTTPADFGSITLNPSVPADNFEVEIKNGSTGGPGAANVGTINLDAPGFTGYSSLEGVSFIFGNLGGLTLVQDGEDPPNGGELAELAGLFVSGDLTGPLTIPTVKGILTVFGNVIGAADITIGKIDGSGITISGSLVCDGVCPDITVTDKIFDGFLTVSGNVPSGSTVKIQQLEEAEPATGTTYVELSNGGGWRVRGYAGFALRFSEPVYQNRYEVGYIFRCD